MRAKCLILASLLSLLPAWAQAQSDAFALQRILQRYTEAYGGFRDADSLSSLSVEGSIEQNGQSYDFVMRKKRPYSMRYALSNAANSLIAGYNGSTGWMRVETDGEVSITALDAAKTRALRAQARFDSPLFRHLEKSDNEVELIERTTLNNNSVYVIEVRESDIQTSRYYLDVQTAHLLRHDQLDQAGAVSFQTIFRDYKEVEGYPFAYEIENRVGDVTVSLAKVRSIEVNPGLLSFYFEKPRR